MIDTFDCSSIPKRIFGPSSLPAVTNFAGPDSDVATNNVPPIARKCSGAANSAKRSCERCCVPCAVVALTVPSSATLTDNASAGIRTPSKRQPAEFLSVPSATRENSPSRVYARFPLPSVSTKNPGPSIAASKGPLLFASLPCLKTGCSPVATVPSPDSPGAASTANVAVEPL